MFDEFGKFVVFKTGLKLTSVQLSASTKSSFTKKTPKPLKNYMFPGKLFRETSLIASSPACVTLPWQLSQQNIRPNLLKIPKTNISHRREKYKLYVREMTSKPLNGKHMFCLQLYTNKSYLKSSRCFYSRSILTCFSDLAQLLSEGKY